MDIAGIVEGAVAGTLTHEITKSPEDKLLNAMLDVHILLQQLHLFLTQNTETVDIYKIVQVFKTSTGPTWLPVTEGRKYLRVFTPLSTVLNIISSPLGPFNVTIPPAVWTPLDLPDTTTYALDTSFALNTAYLWVRYTDDKPAN